MNKLPFKIDEKRIIELIAYEQSMKSSDYRKVLFQMCHSVAGTFWAVHKDDIKKHFKRFRVCFGNWTDPMKIGTHSWIELDDLIIDMSAFQFDKRLPNINIISRWRGYATNYCPYKWFKHTEMSEFQVFQKDYYIAHNNGDEDKKIEMSKEGYEFMDKLSSKNIPKIPNKV